jgi:RsiW-degrading membrane proteinase PrsW (M82 family)
VFIRFVMAAVLTLLPIVILLRFFYTRDVHREPRGVLIGTLVRGVFCVIPILVLGVILSIFWRASWGPWGNALFLSFILAALPRRAE